MSTDPNCQGSDNVTVYEECDGLKWCDRQVKFCEALEEARHKISSTVVIFASSAAIRDCENPPYDIPDLLSPEHSQSSFIGREPTIDTSESRNHVLRSNFCLYYPEIDEEETQIVTSVVTVGSPHSSPVFVLSINVPLQLQRRLQSRALVVPASTAEDGPYHWHIELAREVRDLYAKCLGSLETRFRYINTDEKDILSTTKWAHLASLVDESSHLTAALDEAEFAAQKLFEELRTILRHSDVDAVVLPDRGTWMNTESKLILTKNRFHDLKLRSQTLERGMRIITSYAPVAIKTDIRYKKRTVCSVKMLLTLAGVLLALSMGVSFVTLLGNRIGKLNVSYAIRQFVGKEFFKVKTFVSDEPAWILSPDFWVYCATAASLALTNLTVWVAWQHWR